MLARAQIRQAALASLRAAAPNWLTLAAIGSSVGLPLQSNENVVAAANIFSPGDWNVPPEKLPAILLRCAPAETKRSGGETVPNFTTSITLELKAFAALQTTAEAAQDMIEGLAGRIEDTLFGDYAFNQLVSEVSEVTSVQEIKADGRQHAAGVAMHISLETFELFNPAPPPPLTEITVTVDTIAPADLTGTYTPSPNAPPYTPAPAPRTEGPDGRVEGALDLPLPQ